VLDLVEVLDTSEPPRIQLVKETSTFLSPLRVEDRLAAGGCIFVRIRVGVENKAAELIGKRIRYLDSALRCESSALEIGRNKCA
jgi:hypothetical protein